MAPSTRRSTSSSFFSSASLGCSNTPCCRSVPRPGGPGIGGGGGWRRPVIDALRTEQVMQCVADGTGLRHGPRPRAVRCVAFGAMLASGVALESLVPFSHSGDAFARFACPSTAFQSACDMDEGALHTEQWTEALSELKGSWKPVRDQQVTRRERKLAPDPHALDFIRIQRGKIRIFEYVFEAQKPTNIRIFIRVSNIRPGSSPNIAVDHGSNVGRVWAS